MTLNNNIEYKSYVLSYRYNPQYKYYNPFDGYDANVTLTMEKFVAKRIQEEDMPELRD